MARLEIPISCEDSVGLEICLNKKPLQFEICDNKIISEIDFSGLAILTIKLLTPGKVNFQNVYLDNVNIRQFLFLSWGELNSEKIQPCTDLWEVGQTWVLPISNPLSLLISLGIDKFNSWELGSNLFEKYDIFFPESIEIKESFPKLIKDFFHYDFDFYAQKKVKKDELYGNSKIPFFQFDYEYDKESLYKELHDNYEYLIGQEFYKPYQLDYNKADEQNKFNPDLNWRTIYSYLPKKQNSIDDFTLDKNRLPLLFDFYKQLPLKNIYVSFIGILPPGGYIAPHKDQREGILPHGCTQLYFALNPSEDHYFKLNGVGSIPLDEKTTVVNNQNYTHTVINQGTEMRYAIGLFCDIDPDFFAGVQY
jgi:hypothetical protein